MQKWKDFKKVIWDWFLRNIKSYHFVLAGLILVIFGIYSILKIKNSDWYSGRSIVLGIILIVGGIPVFINEIRSRKS